MTDEAAAAPAATESTPASAQVVSTPQPIESAGPERSKAPEPAKAPEKVENRAPDKKPPTISEAIKNANAAAKEKAAAKVAEKPEGKAAPEAKPAQAPAKVDAERTRGEGGRFAAKDGVVQPTGEGAKPAVDANARPASTYSDPPARFKSDAAAVEAWGRAEEPLRGAMHRVVKELEQGIEKHKAGADQWGELKQFDDFAKRGNTSVKQALTNYVTAEMAIRENPISGLEKLVSNLGLKDASGKAVTFRDLAAYYLGQKPDAAAARNDEARHASDRRADQIEQKLNGVLKHLQEQQQTQQVESVAAMLDELAADHPRMEELHEDIEFFLKSDKVPKNLSDKERISEAYRLAEAINPAAGRQASPARAQTPDDAEAQTLTKGQKSITGAPSSGSDPAQKRKPSSSIRESLERAARAVT